MTQPNDLRMAAVLRLIEDWEADAENDNYSKGDAAVDLQVAMDAACTCSVWPHDRRCPHRRNKQTSSAIARRGSNSGEAFADTTPETP